MSTLTPFPDLGLAREQAVEWVARLDRGLSANEQVEFRRWCTAPANARALHEMSGLWSELDSLRVLAEVFPAEHAPGAGAADAAFSPAATSRAPRRGFAVAAAIACVAVLAGAIGYVLLPRIAGPAAVTTVAAKTAHVTAVGEQRDETLADGSVLSLNTDSLVEVSLGDTTRELQLVRGEVHFNVAHDEQRPFRVRVGGRVVQAVGTAFDVRLHEGLGVEVIVTEGRVRVLDDTGEPVTLAERLDRGETLWVDADGATQLAQLDDATIAARLAWRTGMLVFDGQPLEAALSEFSRYTHTRFEITEPRLRTLRVGGYFPAGDTDALLAALGSEFGLAATRGIDGVIRIGPGSQTRVP